MSTTPNSTATAPTRLASGALRAAVAAHLAADPSTAFTVTQVAKALSASGGAVGNALMALAAVGHAQLICEAPRRFQATETSGAVATFATPSVPKATAPVPAVAMVSGPAPVTVAPAAETVTLKRRVPQRTVSAEAKPGAVMRPNGQAYHPRDLGGHRDVEVLAKLREAGIPALLYGPPGTGKTSMVEAAFGDLITVAGDNDTTVADLVGEYTQNPDGTYEFVYGPLVRAMREGRALLVDDATLIPANVLAVLYPALDGRCEIHIKAHKNELVSASPGFYVIAGHNPGAHGAVLTEALASRFCFQVEVSSDLDLAKFLGIHPKALTIAKNLRRRQASGSVGWCPNLRELLGFRTVAEVLGEDVAFANLIGIAPPEDRATVAEVVTAALGREVSALALGKQL